MAGLGLLLIRSPKSDDILSHLRSDLAIDSHNYEPYMFDWRFRADILSNIISNVVVHSVLSYP